MKVAVLLVLIAPVLAAGGRDYWCAEKWPPMDFPMLALQARVSGVVRLKARIDGDGTVGHARVLSGNRVLGQAAQENLAKWIFGRCSGGVHGLTAHAGEIEIVYDFKLAGMSLSPKTAFLYKPKGRVIVAAPAAHWMP